MDRTIDRAQAQATLSLLDALRLAHEVETPVTGSVIVDGEEITSEAWDRMAMTWDGTPDGLEELGYEDAAEALRDRVEWSVGDRVEGGDTPEDRDTGRVIEVRADGTVVVAWDSGVSTRADAASLRPEA